MGDVIVQEERQRTIARLPIRTAVLPVAIAIVLLAIASELVVAEPFDRGVVAVVREVLAAAVSVYALPVLDADDDLVAEEAVARVEGDAVEQIICVAHDRTA